MRFDMTRDNRKFGKSPPFPTLSPRTRRQGIPLKRDIISHGYQIIVPEVAVGSHVTCTP